MNLESYPVMLKAKHIEEILDLSKGKTYDLLNSKNFPTVRIGRTIRIPRDAFLRWLEDQKAK